MSAVTMDIAENSHASEGDVTAALGHIYGEFFGLKENPFAITPDPRYLYMSARHRDALAHLLFAVKQGGGFVQLTGEVGTGKTTLTRALLSQLPSNVSAAIILNPKQSALEFVQSICDELRVPDTAGVNSIKALTDALNIYLLNGHAEGRRAMVLIDEAQNLGIDVLEQIRLLTNLETTKEKLLQIVLVGQPELRLLLDRKELRQLAQRITARYHLLPLSKSETNEMVKYRLAVAGYTQTLFTDGALRFIHRASKGVPRLINVFCDRALLGAYAENRHTIDQRIVLRASVEVMGDAPASPPPKFPLRTAGAIIGALAIGAMALLYTLSESNDAPGSSAKVETIETPLQPVLEPASLAPSMPEQTETPALPVSFAETIQSQTLRANLDDAMDALFSLWSKDYRAAAGMTPCERALNVGLSCYRGTANWTQLKTLNHPVVLKLTHANGAGLYAVASGANDNSITMLVDTHRFEVPVAEIESLWRGDFLLLWNKPAIGGVTLITPGMQGIAVTWLHNILNRIDGTDAAVDAAVVFDDALRARVRKFQRQYGLGADGIAGEQTMIQLIAAANEAQGPQLNSTR